MLTNSRNLVLDIYDYSGHKLVNLYDNTSDIVGQATDVFTSCDRNGWKELSFSLQNKVDNEPNYRLDFLKADYRIRLQDDNGIDWYLISEPQVSHNNYTQNVSVVAGHVSQLLKQKNLGLVFSDTEGNNVGTAKELLKAILAGTDWYVGNVDYFYDNNLANITSSTYREPKLSMYAEKVRSLVAPEKTGAFKLITQMCTLFDAKPIFHGESYPHVDEEPDDFQTNYTAYCKKVNGKFVQLDAPMAFNQGIYRWKAQSVDIVPMNPFSEPQDGQLPDIAETNKVLELHYGHNMKNVSRKLNTENIVTKLYAYGAYGDKTHGYCGIDECTHKEYAFTGTAVAANFNGHFSIVDDTGTHNYTFKVDSKSVRATDVLIYSTLDYASRMYIYNNTRKHAYLCHEGTDGTDIGVPDETQDIKNRFSFLMDFTYYDKCGLLTNGMLQKIAEYQRNAPAQYQAISEASEEASDIFSKLSQKVGAINFCKLAVKRYEADGEYTRIVLDKDNYDYGVIYRTDYDERPANYFDWTCATRLKENGDSVNSAASMIYIIHKSDPITWDKTYIKSYTENGSATSIFPYSKENVYHLGDKVLQYGSLYVCKVELVDKEEWNSAQWDMQSEVHPDTLTLWMPDGNTSLNVNSDEVYLFETYNVNGQLGSFEAGVESTLTAAKNAVKLSTKDHDIFFVNDESELPSAQNVDDFAWGWKYNINGVASLVERTGITFPTGANDLASISVALDSINTATSTMYSAYNDTLEDASDFILLYNNTVDAPSISSSDLFNDDSSPKIDAISAYAAEIIAAVYSAQPTMTDNASILITLIDAILSQKNANENVFALWQGVAKLVEFTNLVKNGIDFYDVADIISTGDELLYLVNSALSKIGNYKYSLWDIVNFNCPGLSAPTHQDIVNLSNFFIPPSYNGNVDFANRKIIPPELAGASGTYATILATEYTVHDYSIGKDVVALITQIRPDGTVCRGDDMNNYIAMLQQESERLNQSLMTVDAANDNMILRIEQLQDGESTSDETWRRAADRLLEWYNEFKKYQVAWDQVRASNNFFGEDVDIYNISDRLEGELINVRDQRVQLFDVYSVFAEKFSKTLKGVSKKKKEKINEAMLDWITTQEISVVEIPESTESELYFCCKLFNLPSSSWEKVVITGGETPELSSGGYWYNQSNMVISYKHPQNGWVAFDKKIRDMQRVGRMFSTVWSSCLKHDMYYKGIYQEYIYTAGGTVNAGDYCFKDDYGMYWLFTLKQSLAAGETLTYDTTEGTIVINKESIDPNEIETNTIEVKRCSIDSVMYHPYDLFDGAYFETGDVTIEGQTIPAIQNAKNCTYIKIYELLDYGFTASSQTKLLFYNGAKEFISYELISGNATIQAPSGAEFVRAVISDGETISGAYVNQSNSVINEDVTHILLNYTSTAGELKSIPTFIKAFTEYADDYYGSKLPIVTSAQEALKKMDNDLMLTLGDIYREGHWKKNDYVDGDEDKLYMDALDAIHKVSKPEASYQISFLDRYKSNVDSHYYSSGLADLEFPDIDKDFAVHLVDEDIEVNTWAFIDKIRKCYDQPWKTQIEINTNLTMMNQHSFNDVMQNIARVASEVGAKQTKYDKAVIGTGKYGQLAAERLEGFIDMSTAQFKSTVSNVRTDDRGNMIFESADGNTAMILTGSGFGIANSKDKYGDWNWRTAGNGEGLAADMITTGFLSSDRIEAGSLSIDKIDVSTLEASIAVLVDASISTAHISSAQIDSLDVSKLTVDGVPITVDASGKIVATSLIGASSITGVLIADGAITAEKIEAGTITADEISAGAITADKIGAGEVTADKIDAGAITAEKIDVGAITADKIDAGAVTADKIDVNSLFASTAYIENLTAATIDAVRASIADLSAGSLRADIAELAIAQITTANIDNANISWANIDTLTATIASISNAQIGVASIDTAHIVDLDADQFIAHDAVTDRYFIDKLQVRNAQMVYATVGELIIKASDNNYYRLDVDEHGAITPVLATVTAGEIAAGVTSDGHSSIIETDLTVQELSASNVKAINALIDKLTASRINVDELFARQAMIQKLQTTDISSNTSIQLMVRDLTANYTTWEDPTTITYQGSNELRYNVKEGDIWNRVAPPRSNTEMANYTHTALSSYPNWSLDSIGKQYIRHDDTWQLINDTPAAKETQARLLLEQNRINQSVQTIETSAERALSIATYIQSTVSEAGIRDLIEQEVTGEIRQDLIDGAASEALDEIMKMRGGFKQWQTPVETEDQKIQSGAMWLKDHGLRTNQDMSNLSHAELAQYPHKSFFGGELYMYYGTGATYDNTKWTLTSDYGSTVFNKTLFDRTVDGISAEVSTLVTGQNTLLRDVANLNIKSSSISLDVKHAQETADGAYQSQAGILIDAVNGIEIKTSQNSQTNAIALGRTGIVLGSSASIVMDAANLLFRVGNEQTSLNTLLAAKSNIASVYNQYYRSSSPSTPTGGNWSNDAPTWENGYYVFMRTVTTYSDGTATSYSPSQNGTNISGAKGASGSPGSPGAQGTSITDVSMRYALVTSSDVAPSHSSSSWKTTMPAMTDANVGKYYWTETDITYSDGTHSYVYACQTGQTYAQTQAHTAAATAASITSGATAVPKVTSTGIEINGDNLNILTAGVLHLLGNGKIVLGSSSSNSALVIDKNGIAIGSGKAVAINGGSISLASGSTFTVAGNNFSIDASGNVSMTGSVTAQTGYIANWRITANRLRSGSGSTYVALDSDPDVDYAIWAGNSSAASATFSVTKSGIIKATNGIIGGWEISSTSISAGEGTSRVVLSMSTGHNYAFWAGDPSRTAAPFSVKKDGTLYATSGTIGGWHLEPGMIWAGSGSNYIRLQSADGVVFAMWAGAESSGDAPFQLRRTGQIKATLGTIGGWKLETSSLHAGSGSSYVGLSTGTYSIWAGSETDSSAPFYVKRNGELKASVGTVGGWELSANKLSTTGSTSSDYVALSSDQNGEYAMWAGSLTASDAPFRVKKDGTVYLTKLIALDGPPEDPNSREIQVNLRNANLWKLAYSTVRSVENGVVTLSNGTTFNTAASVVIRSVVRGSWRNRRYGSGMLMATRTETRTLSNGVEDEEEVTVYIQDGRGDNLAYDAGFTHAESLYISHYPTRVTGTKQGAAYNGTLYYRSGNQYLQVGEILYHHGDPFTYYDIGANIGYYTRVNN